MKLLFCPECLDVKKVRMLELRRCACGKAWGYYLEDDLTAVMGGTAVPLAIENDELIQAAVQRPKQGRGNFLSARVLPMEYDTLRAGSTPDPSVNEARS